MLSAVVPLLPSDLQAGFAAQPPADIAVNAVPAGNQGSSSVAMDSSGNHVVAWVAYGRAGDRAQDGNIVARRFDRLGQPAGPEFVVNTHFAGSQVQPDVAMDPFGNFVVVWAGTGQDGTNGPVDPQGVFYRRFAFDNTSLDPYERQATTYARGTQDAPSVAMDLLGNFVVTWSGEGRTGTIAGKGTFDHRGVWARRFNAFGQAQDPAQILVNSVRHKASTQEAPDVAVDASGNAFIVWRSERQDAGAWGVYAQRFAVDGSRSGGEIHLNRRIHGAKITPQVAVNALGDAVIVWSGNRREGRSVHVYARRFNAEGRAIDGGREFVVDRDPNPRSPYVKQQAQVAINRQGDFAVTWSSFGQDQAGDQEPRDDGVYARLFHADGSDFVNPATGQPLGAWRVNYATLGNQNAPQVAMDSNGYIAFVWTGPDADQNGIWSRMVRTSAQSSAADIALASLALDFDADRERPQRSDGILAESVEMSLASAGDVA